MRVVGCTEPTALEMAISSRRTCRRTRCACRSRSGRGGRSGSTGPTSPPAGCWPGPCSSRTGWCLAGVGYCTCTVCSSGPPPGGSAGARGRRRRTAVLTPALPRGHGVPPFSAQHCARRLPPVGQARSSLDDSPCRCDSSPSRRRIRPLVAFGQWSVHDRARAGGRAVRPPRPPPHVQWSGLDGRSWGVTQPVPCQSTFVGPARTGSCNMALNAWLPSRGVRSG